MEDKIIIEETKENKKFKNLKIKRWNLVKWALGVAIIIAGIIFIGVNNDLCYNTFTTSKMNKAEKVVVQLNANSTCTQVFKGYNGTLEKVGLYMDNQGREDSTGTVEIVIKDENGKEVGKSIKNAISIRTRKYNMFIFDNKPELNKDKTYTMEIKCIDFNNPQTFGIYINDSNASGRLEAATIDGKPVAEGMCIRAQFVFGYYDYTSMKCMMGLLILGLIFACIPYGFITDKIKKKWNVEIHISRWMSRILFVVAPIISYFMMEVLSAFSVMDIAKSVISLKGILNIAIYAILLLIFYAITNRTQYSAIILWIFTFVFGLVNYFVTSFRVIPVLAADIMSMNTALNVANNYEYTFDIWVLWSTTIFATFVGLMMAFEPYKGLKKIKRAVLAVITIVVMIFSYEFFINSTKVADLGIEDSQWKPQLRYAKNGSILSFTISWKYIKTEKPEGYSVDKVKKVTAKYQSDEVTNPNARIRKKPNVIAIMNESLADFEFDGELKTSEDYLPFIRSMKENTIKGKLYVSIWGANTANSEFEFLSGNSMAFFAPRAVPYNNYVKGVVPSLTRTLVAQGYIGNNSYHPYKRNGWNRENVYNSFGFNHFYSDEYYQDAEYVRNFISDKSDMEQIIKDYEEARKTSTAPFYLFNVTVQNHGGYVGNRGFVDIDVKSESEGMNDDEVNQYLTLAKKSDEAFEKLIKYFESIDDPTVIVMFGDHQPPLSNKFYSNLFGTDVNKFSTDQTAAYYSTPYVIWANYDIEEQQDVDMSANYLSSYVLNLIGADLTGYNKYLLDLQKKLPVITGLFYAGDDGVFRNIDEESQYTSVINEYSQIQYNGLFDKKNRIDEFFFLKGGAYKVKSE